MCFRSALMDASFVRSRVSSCALSSSLMEGFTSAPPPRRTSSTRWSNFSWWSFPPAPSTPSRPNPPLRPCRLSSPAPGRPAQSSTKTCWPSSASQRWASSTSTARTTGRWGMTPQLTHTRRRTSRKYRRTSRKYRRTSGSHETGDTTRSRAAWLRHETEKHPTPCKWTRLEVDLKVFDYHYTQAYTRIHYDWGESKQYVFENA